MNRKDVAVGFGWNFLFTLPNRILFPIFGIIIARILGPEEFGVYGVLTVILSISDVLRDAGLAHAYIVDRDLDDSKETVYHTFGTVNAFLLAAAVFLLRDVFANFFNLPQLSGFMIVVSIALFANGLSAIPHARLQRDQRFRDAGIAQSGAALVSYGIALPMVFGGFGFQALVWQLLVRSILQLVITYWMAPIGFGRVSKSFLVEASRRTRSILAQNLMYTAYTLLDKALIGRLFGPIGLGHYSIAWNLAIKPVEFVSWPMVGTLFVAYSKHSGDPQRFAAVFCRSLAAASLITLPMFVYIGLFAPELILVLYTHKFAYSIPILQLMAIYFAFRSLGTMAGSALVAAQKPYLNVWSWAGGFAVALTGLALSAGGVVPVLQRSTTGGDLTLTYGALGLVSTAAWITLGACTAYTLLISSAFWALKPMRSDLGRIGKAIAAGLLPAAACVLLRLLPLEDAPTLLVSLGTVALVQALVIGSLYGGTPAAAFSKSGLKRIWNSL